ncbi:MAG: carboxypeptidase-like regulatory domain-containing protein [Acidobacteriota bacterium]|nr:carboxypeptidase-like regulatory domain-containing protein [Acidobacteriota bacterium]
MTDQTKSVIAGAAVTLLNVNTGIKTVRKTSDTGLYLFDLVDPGTYSVTIEETGFGVFVQENIVMQTRGDVTVNATLTPGAVRQNITVNETPADVQFNSSNKDLTIDSKMATEIPRFDRNPFKLTLIAPSAVNTRGEMQPYHSWSANSVDLGGGTNLKNDLQVDGMPVGMGQKNSTPPNTDDVQEVIVSTNSVDAESGHSAGGLITMTTKSGTNDWHGNAFYLGRYPWLNAAANRTTNSFNAQRQHMIGGTLGNPIIKNKLFNFFSMEYWKVGYPNSYARTVPTAAEAAGDFSHSLNIDGTVRTIYDPFSTQFNPATGVVSRTAFPGNIVPANRFDPLSASLIKQFWAPNNPGDNITGVNNFRKGFIERYGYYNFSDRVDYNINDRWKVFGRVARYNTTDLAGNPTPNNSDLYVPTGTSRAATNIGGDAVWTVSPRTVVDFHGDWHKLIDAYISQDLGNDGWSKIWPGNQWYKPYQDASVGVPVYFPNMNIGGQGFGGGGFYWNQKPAGEASNVKIAQQRGSHYLKAGFEQRRSFGLTYVSSTSNFFFPAAVTAETFNNPDTLHNGSGFATFLLGALDGSSQMVGGPAPDPHVEFYGMYFQDDWKVNRRITINLGLRNEYETAIHDPAHNFSQGLDLSKPVPEMQANPPAIPSQATSIVGSNFYKFNGLWNFTTAGHPGMWDPQKLALAPRAGIAYRIDDRTALRFGYARYLIPYELNIDLAPVSGYETVGFLEPPFLGLTGYQNTLGLLQGVPQQTIANPYPSNNPLLPILGKGYGTNLGRGGQALLWYPQNNRKARNDRFNVNFQRQLQSQIVVSATYFLNLGNQQYTKNLNKIDPALQQQYQNSLNQQVDNPFFNYLTPTLFPGPLRNQKQVSLGSLLVPYPQYGGLYQIGTLGAAERYHSLEFKAQKAFSKGYNFLVSYVYIREKNQTNTFNDLNAFQNNLVYQDSNQPHHRFNIAGTWELPVGAGRAYFNSAPKVVEAVVGGWKVAGLWTFISGDFPRFGNLGVSGNPCVSNPTPKAWFNTAAFSRIPANTYVLRTNPLQYDCLTGPQFWNLDANLAKEFRVTEKVRAELKMAAYNATNRLNRGDPDTNVLSSTFGQALFQGSPGGSFGAQGATYGNQSGRQVELGLKIIF